MTPFAALWCSNLDLSGNLAKMCKERIKDFKQPNDSTEKCGFIPPVHVYDDFDDVYPSGYPDDEYL
ncbi:RNI-like superfamily protein [Artemisia annua]|uniref:RNI-like superfamily protein n=1 Tax=Artemisia annua TaxID=35608 RepID=A0A2U1PVD0_ARTAN|nr:RNI-like superfamily protein [Artemisia annua]